MFGLLLAIFPTVIVLLWLLHQKGFFDPLYDWWDDRFEVVKQGNSHNSEQRRDKRESALHLHEGRHYHLHPKGRHYQTDAQNKQRDSGAHHGRHKHSHSELVERDDYHHGHNRRHLHVHTGKNKHKHRKNYIYAQQGLSLNRKGRSGMMGEGESLMNYKSEYHKYKREREALKGSLNMTRHNEEKQCRHNKHGHGQMPELLHSNK